MKEFFLWWLGAEAVGFAAFPLAFAFFHRLPDRGFAFSKVVGLLLLGYGVWAGAVVGLFPNSRGSVILVLLLIAGLSAIAAGRKRDELAGYLRSGWRYMLFVEVLFFAVLASAVFIRSFAPEIIWGEKPFELAFLNSVSRSEFYPPNDPWLSGHSISYYYFGYVMIAALTKLVALSTNVTFYLALSLTAALASVTGFGLVYNMIVASRRRTGLARTEGPPLIPRALVFGLATAGLMLIVSNLAGVFELMARHGIGSTDFYGGVGIFGLDSSYDCSAAPGDCSEWYPTRFWWWWKATRMGSPWDIQEFPFFSFQFGDLHPHVLVMPFLITLFGTGFQWVLGARADRGGGEDDVAGGDDAPQRGDTQLTLPSAYPWRSLLLALLLGSAVLVGALALDVSPVFAVLLALAVGVVQAILGALVEGQAGDGGQERLDALWWMRHPGRFILAGLLLGGVLFIDSWTLPLATMMVIAAALVANWLRTGRRPLRAAADSLGFAVPIVAAMILFYLPFYMNLDVETRGLNITQTAITGHPPAASETTRPLHFLLFWGPLLWVGLSFLAVELFFAARRGVARLIPQPTLALAVVAWAAPLGLWMLLVVVTRFSVHLGLSPSDWQVDIHLSVTALVDEFEERGASLITLLIIIASLTAVGVAFLHQLRKPPGEQDRGQLFAFHLAGFVFLMLLGAELFFVKDLFNWRVNTVFRFWHQSWIMLAIVGGFGLYRVTLGWRLPEVRPEENFWPRLALAGVILGAAYTLFVVVEPWDVLYAEEWLAMAPGIFVAGVSIVGYAVALAMGRRLPRVRLWRGFWPSVALGGVAFGAAYTLFVAVEPWDVLYAKHWTATLGLFIAGVSIVAYAVAAAAQDVPKAVAGNRIGWLGFTVVILAAALVYPVTVTFERTGGFRSPQSLNGLVHVERGDPAEYEAMQWLNANVDGTPVILEAVGDEFSDFSRVSTRTGLPTVIGWPGHELQWRGYLVADAYGQTPLADRPEAVATIYTTADIQEARSLLDNFNVEYVYVGQLEREKYGEGGLAKFREFMVPVFENEGVIIYRMAAQTTTTARAR